MISTNFNLNHRPKTGSKQEVGKDGNAVDSQVGKFRRIIFPV